ncbi:MAG TPA: isocitrate lyase/phosphoenolpyruvate mutase family protein [Nitrospiria bacterium]
MEKGKNLKRLLKKPGLLTVVGAHDAISAKLIEKAGFDGIWASGFGISAAQQCTPDASVLTMTESLQVTKAMCDAVQIPVIADCDNGFGNAINVMRTVNEYEAVGVAGICIEDNIFPKRCSFYPGVKRELVSIEEHAGKVKAAKKAQRFDEFVVIARTEAFIAGWGKEEALKRARAYAEAGADAILVHSKSSTFDELKDFAESWNVPVPLVIVPTIFSGVRLPELQEAGFKIVIFANQVLRSSIQAMKETLHTLKISGQAKAVEDRIVPLEEVYDLIGVSELKENEAEFLPKGAEKVRAVVMAAGFEEELLPLTEDKPKAMLDIKGKTILERQVEALNHCGIKDIAVVRGYKKEMINLSNLRYYDNDRFEKTGEVYSLFCAERELEGPLILLYSDIVFDPGVLEKLLKSEGDVVLVVDRAWNDQYRGGFFQPSHAVDLVITASPPPSSSHRFVPRDEEDQVLRIGQSLLPDQAHGEFIGMAMLSPQGAIQFRKIYHELMGKELGKKFQEAPSLEKISLTDMVQEMIDRKVSVKCIDIYKGWMEVDTFGDYQRAWGKIKK